MFCIQWAMSCLDLAKIRLELRSILLVPRNDLMNLSGKFFLKKLTVAMTLAFSTFFEISKHSQDNRTFKKQF